MPIAVADTNSLVRHDLKSLPGAWVELKRMNYGQSVQRRAMLKMSVATTKGSKDFKGDIAMASEEITRFEFKLCVVAHNLEKEDGVLLSLGQPVDFALLDPRVGQEIEGLISDMNNFDEDDDDLGN